MSIDYFFYLVTTCSQSRGRFTIDVIPTIVSANKPAQAALGLRRHCYRSNHKDG